MLCIQSFDHVSCTLRWNEGGRVRGNLGVGAGSRGTINNGGSRVGIKGALGKIWGRRMADGRRLFFLPSIDKHIGVSRREDIAILTKSNS